MSLIICTVASAVLSAAATFTLTWALLRRRETRIERAAWSAARIFYTRQSKSSL